MGSNSRDVDDVIDMYCNSTTEKDTFWGKLHFLRTSFFLPIISPINSDHYNDMVVAYMPSETVYMKIFKVQSQRE